MFDNMTITRHGQVFLQEDPGVPSGFAGANPDYLAMIWLYSIDADTLTPVAQADPNRFVLDAPDYVGTRDEESSGIIDASEILGVGWFLLTMQAPHGFVNPGDVQELVAGGQLLAMHAPPRPRRQ